MKVQTGCLLVLAAITVAAAMKLFSAVIIPFVMAIFLTFCFAPVIELQIKFFRLPRFIALTTTIVFVCMALLLAGIMISASVKQISDNRVAYELQIRNLLDKAIEAIPDEKLDLDIENLSRSMYEMLSNTAKKIFTGTVTGILSVLSNGILVVIFMVFMLTGKDIKKIKKGSLRSIIESQIQRYTFTMLITSGITGFLVGLTLKVLGVDFAWMFGFLAFLLNFIPNIGSIIATIFPIPVVLLSPELSIAAKVLAIVIPSVIQFVVGNLMQPKMLGQSLDLHPVTILLALIFFGAIWGIIGMLLAAPITAAMKILLEKFEYTKNIARLMAGQLESLEMETN